MCEKAKQSTAKCTYVSLQSEDGVAGWVIGLEEHHIMWGERNSLRSTWKRFKIDLKTDVLKITPICPKLFSFLWERKSRDKNSWTLWWINYFNIHRSKSKITWEMFCMQRFNNQMNLFLLKATTEIDLKVVKNSWGLRVETIDKNSKHNRSWTLVFNSMLLISLLLFENFYFVAMNIANPLICICW